jgi:hypothetical protein
MQSTPKKQAGLESPGESTEHWVKQDRHKVGAIVGSSRSANDPARKIHKPPPSFHPAWQSCILEFKMVKRCNEDW